MDTNDTDYYRQGRQGYIIPSGNKNTILLKRIENDVSKLQGDITRLKEDISFIKDYIIAKKEREDNRWF